MTLCPNNFQSEWWHFKNVYDLIDFCICIDFKFPSFQLFLVFILRLCHFWLGAVLQMGSCKSFGTTPAIFVSFLVGKESAFSAWDPGWEDLLEKGMPIHSNILAWRIPWTEASGSLQSMGSQRARHYWAHFHFALCYNIVSFLLQSLLWNSCCGKFLKRWEYQTTLPASWEICMQVKKQQLEPDMEQQTGSKSGKEYVKPVYCHPAYLTYMQSTWCKCWAGWSTSWNQDCWEKYQ